VVCMYLAAWRQGFYVEHLGFVEDRVGEGSTFDMVTGGGSLFLWLMRAARPFGTLGALLVIHAVLDLAMVLFWSRAAHRLVPSPVLSTLILATFWVPKAHAAENSALVVFPAALLFLATLRAHEDATPRALAAVVGSALLTIHLSITGLLVMPTVFLAVVVRPDRTVRKPLAAVAGVVVLVGTIAFFASGAADGAIEMVTRIYDDIFRPPRMTARWEWMPLRLFLNPLVLLGGWVAVREDSLPLRLALVWYFAALLPSALVAAYGEMAAYHAAGLAPAWAILSAAGVKRLLSEAETRIGRPPGSLLPATAAVIVAGAVIWAALPTRKPPPEFACWTVLDQAPPCRSRELQARLDQLRALDALDPTEEAVFYGSHGACLTGAWTWFGGAEVERPARMLLIERDHATDALAETLGGWLTEDLIVVPNVIPMWLNRVPPPEAPALVSRVAPGQVLRWAYVAMESDRLFGPHLGEPHLAAPYLDGACWGLPSGPSMAEIAAGWTIADAPTPPDPDYWNTTPGWLNHADNMRFETVIMIPGPAP